MRGAAAFDADNRATGLAFGVFELRTLLEGGVPAMRRLPLVMIVCCVLGVPTPAWAVEPVRSSSEQGTEVAFPCRTSSGAWLDVGGEYGERSSLVEYRDQEGNVVRTVRRVTSESRLYGGESGKWLTVLTRSKVTLTVATGQRAIVRHARYLLNGELVAERHGREVRGADGQLTSRTPGLRDQATLSCDLLA